VTRPPMGYQPGLDGLRAVAVIAVMLYHLHALDRSAFGWFKGGYFGVEVFFVVSGYLITSLLIEEQAKTDHTDFRQFWLRRARRLLPALFAMLITIGVWAALWRPDTLARLRTDLPGAFFYYSNWLQVFDDVGYFAALDTPPLLRHLWSLAVEEQWYLLWPLVFALLMSRTAGRAKRLLAPIAIAGVITAVLMMVLFRENDPDRANFLYLGTVTRASGLLLGAALATRWCPWRWSGAARRHLVLLDAVGFLAIIGLGVAVVTLDNESPRVYQGGFLVVSLLSLVAIAAVVHPGARGMRAVFGSAPLVQVGKRSYGLYLWHWPIFVLVGATLSSFRLVAAVGLTIVFSETCYRFVETPVRKGALGSWLAQLRSSVGLDRSRIGMATVIYGVAAVAIVVPLAVRVLGAEERDLARDDSNEVTFDLAAAAAAATTVPSPDARASSSPSASASPSSLQTPPSSGVAAPSTTAATLPRRLAIVGDSQAHSLAVNLPAGLDSTFSISDGSVEGCGVWDEGVALTTRPGFKRAFGGCEGWADEWADSVTAANAEVALVVIGAWDVFDVDTDAGLVEFGTAQGDAEFTRRVRSGVEALKRAGAKVALLEVPCMRPVDSAGAGVPPLPERADDERTQHLNELLAGLAADDPANVFFVNGPTAWCNDESIATDVNYRWDGVHVYKPGAKLIYESIAASLLQIPVFG
jgi:peptidoglycan/LPS O-acetylase OafA/YrhL